MRYDPDTGRHDLLYDLDQQTESVRLESEPIMFGAISNLVWVQVKHFPRWPAVVVDINAKTIASDAKYYAKSKKEAYIFFFGTAEHIWVKPADIVLINSRGAGGGESRAGPATKRKARDGPKVTIAPLAEFSTREGSYDEATARALQSPTYGSDLAEALSQVKFEVEAYRRVRHEQMARFKSLQRDSRIALTQPPGGTASRGDAPSGGRAFDWVGRAVRHFRQDVNAPHGALCRATVVRYSPAERRHLLVYEPLRVPAIEALARCEKDHLPDLAIVQPLRPQWVNLAAKGVLLELAAAPTKPAKASASRSPVLPKSNGGNAPTCGVCEQPHYVNEMLSCVRAPRARACARASRAAHPCFLYSPPAPARSCARCSAHYHPYCLNANAAAQQPIVDAPAAAGLSKAETPVPVAPTIVWYCADCEVCRGCGASRGDATSAGAEVTLTWQKTATGDHLLCAACLPKFRAKQYCPTCFQMWPKKDLGDGATLPSVAATASMGENGDADEKPAVAGAEPAIGDDGDDMRVEPAEKEEDVGDDSIKCDVCRFWVHAACDAIGAAELRQIREGTHPVLGSGFFCPVCRRSHVAKVIKELSEHDEMNVFGLPVTAEMAPTYFDVIRTPMDLQTMSEKAARGEYKSLQPVREDVELMCLNAATFNRTGDRIWRESCRFFHAATETLEGFAQATHASVHAASMLASEQAHREKDKAIRHAKSTLSAKDAVAGAIEGLASWKLPSIAAPRDVLPCIDVTELQLTTHEGHASAWLDLCFVCGSAGLDDALSVFCADCGEAFHAACVSAPLESMGRAARATWRCQNCKVCEVCGTCTSDEEGELIFCELCDKGYHLHCLSPPLRAVPEGTWVCAQCVSCTRCGAARHPRASWSPRADVCAPCLREERADRTRCAFASCGRACITQVDLTAARRDVATVTDVNMILVCNACGVRFHFQCALREDAIPQSAADEQEPLIFCPRCCMPPQRPADSALLAIDSEPAAPGGAADSSTADARATDAEAEAVHDITSFEPVTEVVEPEPVSTVMDGEAENDTPREDNGVDAAAVPDVTVVPITDPPADVPARAANDAAIAPIEAHSNAAGELADTADEPADAPIDTPADVPDAPVDMLITDAALTDGPADATDATAPARFAACPAYPEIEPLEGWTTTDRGMRELGEWCDERVCSICRAVGDCERSGRLLPMEDGMWVHCNCALWSSEVYEVDGQIVNAFKARSRGSHLNCSHCGAPGATMGCCHHNCKRNYHFTCGGEAGAVCVELIKRSGNGAAQVFCPEHAPPITATASELGAPSSMAPTTEAGAGDVLVPNGTATSSAVSSRSDSPPTSMELEVGAAVHSNPEPEQAIELDEAAPEAGLMPNGSPMEDEDADAEHSVAPTASAGNGVDGSADGVENGMSVGDDGTSSVADDDSQGTSDGDTAGRRTRPRRHLPSTAVAEPETCDTDNAGGCAGEPTSRPVVLRADETRRVFEVREAAGDVDRSLRIAHRAIEAASGPTKKELPQHHGEQPMLRVGALTVHTLGECARGPAAAGFHTAELIFPPGFRATRVFWSYTNPMRRVLYLLEILDSRSDAGRAALRHVRPRPFDADEVLAALPRKTANAIMRATPGKAATRHGAERADEALRRATRAASAASAATALVDSVAPAGVTDADMDVDADGAGAPTGAPPEATTPASPASPRRAARAEPPPHAVFRVTASDDLGNPIVSVSLDELYWRLWAAVHVTNAEFWHGEDGVTPAPVRSDDAASARADKSARGLRRREHFDCFGLSGAQFFGVAIASVRRSIEMMPGAVEAALYPTLPGVDTEHARAALGAGTGAGAGGVRYGFCYVQRSEDEVHVALREQAVRDAELRVNPHGNARAEPWLKIDIIGTTASGASADRITRGLVRVAADSAPVEMARRRQPRGGGADGVGAAGDVCVVAGSVVPDETGVKEKYWAMKAVPLLERLSVKRSHIHGWGLYLKVNLERDEPIVEYMGEVVRQCVADKRERHYEASGVGSCYLFRLDRNEIVDATRRGNLGRFINHSCDPNAYARTIQLDARTKKIVIFSRRDMHAGEEVTYDYKFPIEDDKIVCLCGSTSCRGSMN